MNPGSPFAFKGEIYKNLAILRFLLPLFAENTEIILSRFAPSTQRFFRRLSNAETETLDALFWLSLRRASLGFKGLEPALGGYLCSLSG